MMKEEIKIASGYQHQQTHLMTGDETVWGTGTSVNTVIGTVMNFTPNLSWTIIPVRGVGDGRETQDFIKTRLNVTPNVTYEVHNFSFLKHAVGPLAGAGTVGSPYTVTEADHTGTTAASQIIPFSLEVGSEATTDDVDTYSGCFINDFTLNFNLGEKVTCTANLVAKTVTSSTSATTYTSPTTKPLVMSDGTFKWGATPSQVAGIRSASVSYANNLIIQGEWGTLYIIQPETGERVINWSVTCVMTQTVATTLRDDFYGQANSPLDTTPYFTADKEIEIAVDEGTSSGDRRNYIYLDQCVIESIGKPIAIGNTDLVLLTVNGRAETSGKTGTANVFAKWWTV